MTDETKEVVASASEAKETKDDISKLSDTDIRFRAKYKETKAELEEVKAKSESEKRRLSDQLTEREQHLKMLEEKYVDTELTRQATDAGIKDLEFLKLADRTYIKLVDGKVEGIDKTINELKTRKPDWFGQDKKTSTSSGASFARETTHTASAQTKSAWDMNKSDFSKAKADLTRGRYR